MTPEEEPYREMLQIRRTSSSMQTGRRQPEVVRIVMMSGCEARAIMIAAFPHIRLNIAKY
jgi:hypothetical protein